MRSIIFLFGIFIFKIFMAMMGARIEIKPIVYILFIVYMAMDIYAVKNKK